MTRSTTMEQNLNILFALLRSAISGAPISEDERKIYCREMLPGLIKISNKHDVAHLAILGLKKNNLIAKEDSQSLEKQMLKAVFRHERLEYEYGVVCSALEDAKIPFIPLKGSILRRYYPEAWMRTSCDIDILVHNDDLSKTLSFLTEKLDYTELERATHDVAMKSPEGNHVEIHFDLVEEGRANNAIKVLSSVWDDVSLCENSSCRYEMSDEFFYFYHIAHMAKHFENGGCGIRPFIDLFILDHIDCADQNKRDMLLATGGLFQFAESSRKLCKVWFEGDKHDNLSLQLQNFILHGGVYGSSDNRVAIQQKKKGGKLGYIVSRIFVPYSKLKRYYPILEKHRWLTPVMQVRRWFMLLKPDIAKMAKTEISINSNIDKTKAEEMNVFLKKIGL